MKKSLFLSLVFLIAFSASSFSQKKHKPNHGHNNWWGHNHNHNNSWNHTHNHFVEGLFTNIFFNEVLGFGRNNYREMYFSYKPHQQNWRLTEDYTRGLGFNKRSRVVAKFENPGGGRDFSVVINKHGEWMVDCPRKYTKMFKNKVRRNL